MTLHKTLRSEIEELRAEMAHLRESKANLGDGEEIARPETATIQDHIAELNRMVQQMIEDAEVAVGDHPVATIAGALALGIVIGRLTAR